MITRYYNIGENVLINKDMAERAKVDTTGFDFDVPYKILDFRVKNNSIEYYFGYTVLTNPLRLVPWDENKKRTFFAQSFLLKYYERKTIKNGVWDWTKLSS